MKIALMETDIKLCKKIHFELRKYDIETILFSDKEEFLNIYNTLETYSLIVANLCLFSSNQDYLKRQYETHIPTLLMLENADYDTLKNVYYQNFCSDIIIKPFEMPELIFRVFKLCKIWRKDLFYINKNLLFDKRKSVLILNTDKTKSVKLGKKESDLLKILILNYPMTTSTAEIMHNVYQGEIVSEDRVRSLIRQIRKKALFDIIENIQGIGYKLKVIEL